jgi:hypothetical protein
MFKNKSPLGKENLINDWFNNEQTRVGMSPIKSPGGHLEPSFSKTRKIKNTYTDRTLPTAQHHPGKRVSDPLDLECKETL